jgi:hypothetical protein
MLLAHGHNRSRQGFMRVLLVDDDPRFVSTFGMTLEREGHLVVGKAHGC